MDITIKEPLYILHDNGEYIVRPGTIGVDRNKVVYFYDNTRTSAVGFSRDFCLENPQLFQVAKTLSDREVSQKDVLKILDEYSHRKLPLSGVYERIKSL